MTVTLQYYAVDKIGFDSCDFTRGSILPESEPLLIAPEHLNDTVSYFIGN